ncbi:MAG: formylglycine-generating enzyme family protein [Nannocystaceae bacterium]
MLGYDRVPEPEPVVAPPRYPTVIPLSEPEPEPVRPTRTRQALLDIPYWQPRSYTWHDEAERSKLALSIQRQVQPSPEIAADDEQAASERAQATAPTPELLSTRARLLPMLERSITAELTGEELDVPELVTRWSRGEPLRQLPRQRRRGWPSLVLILDRDYDLVPFWHDQESLLADLRHRVGSSGLVVRYVDEYGPEEGMHDAKVKPVSPYDGSLAGLPVLALTDLGWLRGPGHRRAWLRFGRRLRQAGEQLLALVPVPQVRWTRALARTWSPLPWEQPAPEDGDALDPEVRSGRVARLLAMAALAQRLEPGLLRELRRLLPRSDADVGTEADAWLHQDMGGSFPTATVVRGQAAQAWREHVVGQDPALRHGARDALRRWHWWQGLGQEVWHTEALVLDGLVPGIVDAAERARAERFLVRLAAEAKPRAGGAASSSRRGDIRRWLDYVELHVPVQLWRSDTQAGRGLQMTWWAARDDRPPPDADPRLRQPGTDEAPPEDRELLVRHGGSPVATMTVARPRVIAVSPGHARELSVSGELAISAKPGAAIELRTDRSSLRLEPLSQPSWAAGIGRDSFGLWAELKVKGVVQRMRWIPPGRFVMGSPGDELGRWRDEGPAHPVTITRGFWLGDTPVTQAMWKAVTGEDPSHFEGDDRRPVEQVSWEDCQTKLIEALNRTTPSERGEVFRLPTEAQWEHACRAGTKQARYSENLDEIAWYDDNSGGQTHPVGEKLPNPWGLYDMLGNVREWCLDGMRGYEDRARKDPVGSLKTGGLRVDRGGSWADGARYVRAACRFRVDPGDRYLNQGLRLARDQPVRTDPGPEGE